MKRRPRPDKAMQAAIGSGFYQAMQGKADQDRTAHHCCGKCHKPRLSVAYPGDVCACCKLRREAEDRIAKNNADAAVGAES